MSSRTKLGKRTDEALVDRIGIQCLVVRADSILLGRRLGVFGSGSWGLPGGKLAKGETILEAAARELLEETGLIMKDGEVGVIGDAIPDNNYHLQIGIIVRDWTGDPQIKEPESCSELRFFSLHDLPRPLFVSSAPLIEGYKDGKLY
jgi:8-oxo-dGTP diphosphatase